MIYKDMPLKPSILKGMESILGSKKVESFVSQKEDYIIIEDCSGRVRVAQDSPMTNYSSGDYVTGIIVSAKGRIDDKGLFLIEDILFPSMNNFPLKKLNFDVTGGSVYSLLNSNNPLILYISGLNFGKVDHSGRLSYARNLFVNSIQGRLGNVKVFERVVRLIIVGNSVQAPDETDLVEKGSYLKADINNRVYKTFVQNYDELDSFINTLSHSVTIDLMPGADDISSSFFPQMAISSIMLPISSHNSSVNLVTNPYQMSLGGLTIMGTSGQNVDNIRKYSSVSPNPTDILEKTLEWGHISPSAPDTLRTYPIIESDPLILRSLPHIYFTGNQSTFETKISNYNSFSNETSKVRLISVPDFSTTFSFVLVDTFNLNTCEYTISLSN